MNGENISGDLELNRLLLEIDHVVGQLLFIVNNPCPLCQDQPVNDNMVPLLQSENAELKRFGNALYLSLKRILFNFLVKW